MVTLLFKKVVVRLAFTFTEVFVTSFHYQGKTNLRISMYTKMLVFDDR